MSERLLNNPSRHYCIGADVDKWCFFLMEVIAIHRTVPDVFQSNEHKFE